MLIMGFGGNLNCSKTPSIQAKEGDRPSNFSGDIVSGIDVGSVFGKG